MEKLLNQITWAISIIIWYLISYNLILLFIWDNYYDNFFLWIMVSSILFWSIIKWLLFNKAFIKERLQFFYSSIERNILNNLEIEKIENKDEIKKENIQIKPEAKENELNNQYIKEQEKINQEKEIQEKIYNEKREKILSENRKIEEKVHKVKKDNELLKYLKSFFQENLLAKIWAILVFIWVLFLMGLIWNSIWQMMKLTIWFIIWFTIYTAWVYLDKLWIYAESKILLWTWILINFLVILWWRHILESNVNSSEFLSAWVTLVFLVLNTIFAVFTSLVYKSKTLLFFSFILAYINPLLLWEPSKNPYNLISYSLIVSLWAIYIWIKQKLYSLVITSFVLWNILFLIAPFSNEIWWVSKLVFSSILWIITLVSLHLKSYKNLSILFILNYVFLILLLNIKANLNLNNLWLITYYTSIISFFFIWITLFIKNSIKNINYILFFPVWIVLLMIFTWNIFSIELLLWLTVISYLISFRFVYDNISNFVKYLFFSILWAFIIIVNFVIWVDIRDIEVDKLSTIVSWIISIVFFLVSYLYSRKENLAYLYSIWTIWTIWMLLPITNIVENYYLNIFILVLVLIFALVNTLFPLINKNLIWEKVDIKNLVLWSIIWSIYIWFELYKYWQEFFPGVTLWISFTILAIYYFIIAVIVINNNPVEKEKTNEKIKNAIYNYLLISISFFTLSIAIIFSDNPSIISIIWLIEATILYFFYSKTDSKKIYILSVIISIIWSVQLIEIVSNLDYKEYSFYITFIIILLSFILNIFFTKNKENSVEKWVFDIVNMIWVSTLLIWILIVTIDTKYLLNVLIVSIVFIILAIKYAYYNSKITKWYFIFITLLIFLFHVNEFDYYKNFSLINSTLFLTSNLSIISILWIVIYLFNKVNKYNTFNNTINIISLIYFVTIISKIILFIFWVTFAVTIFWWLIGISILFVWITNDKIKLRTLWLYTITAILLKIFLYDVWYSIDDAISRVIVFIVLWILLIIISILYSRKYWENLMWEFSPWNLTDNNDNQESKIKNEKKEIVNKKETISEEEKIKITNKIKDIDISDYNIAIFKIDWKAAFKTSSKNLLQIIIYVTKTTWLNKFEAWELDDFYDYIKNNYISNLNSRDYNTVANTFKIFVDKWGEIELK